MFVYGTLQPGGLRWPFLAQFATGHRRADVAGLLFDSGRGWPAAVFDPTAGSIPGVVVDLDPGHADEALTLLDRVEDTVDGLFHRVVVTTAAGERAWAYEWGWPTDGLTRIDRWSETRER